MLRVGLTGGLGSGKSTAARLFAQCGAYVLQADEIARELMQPGEAVYNSIVQHFGPAVVRPDGQLDRAALSRIAFVDGRVEELNAIVHPATIAEQAAITAEIAEEDPVAVVIVESALLFETKHGASSAALSGGASAPWRTRFDCIILVTASEEAKIERYLQRVAEGDPLTPERRTELAAEARRRLAQQIPDERKAELSDFILSNDSSIEELEEQVEELWPVLHYAAANTP
jgi:dephospho-CoA kinase